MYIKRNVMQWCGCAVICKCKFRAAVAFYKCSPWEECSASRCHHHHHHRNRGTSSSSSKSSSFTAIICRNMRNKAKQFILKMNLWKTKIVKRNTIWFSSFLRPAQIILRNKHILEYLETSLQNLKLF